MTTAYFEEGSTAMLQLEAMVDRVGLGNVFYALEHICYAKAEHIQANWQDWPTAKEWNQLGNAMREIGRAVNTYARLLTQIER